MGNGWREEMICSVKAQALASGQVDEVLVHNVNGDASAQIAGIRNLISSGANAIIINPADREALNPVIKEAAARDIVVVAVDQAVTAPEAYVVTNDQVAYGRLGAEWLAEKLGGKGNIVEMRGISGVPADDDRHKGFMEVIAAEPGHEGRQGDLHRLVVRAGRQAGQRHPELQHEGRRLLDVGHRLRGRRRAQEGRPGEACRSSAPTTTSSSSR